MVTWVGEHCVGFHNGFVGRGAVAAGTNGANVCPSSLELLTYSVAVEVLAGWGNEAKAIYSVPAASTEG